VTILLSNHVENSVIMRIFVASYARLFDVCLNTVNPLSERILAMDSVGKNIICYRNVLNLTLLYQNQHEKKNTLKKPNVRFL
jgi:hypothetical protein